MKLKKSVQNGRGKQMSNDSQQSTAQNQTDNSQLNGNIIQVENSPFCIVKEKGMIFIVMGKEVIKKCNNVNEARKLIEKRDWELILTASVIYNKYINENNK